jgi:hypothetical protein
MFINCHCNGCLSLTRAIEFAKLLESRDLLVQGAELVYVNIFATSDAPLIIDGIGDLTKIVGEKLNKDV